MTVLMSPMWLSIAGAVLLIVMPAAAVLFWQHRRWRQAEQLLAGSEEQYAAVEAALNASPDGFYAWMGDDSEEDQGVCSRRLAVLLDLYRGLESDFNDVLNGFDRTSTEQLSSAVDRLRMDGRGFDIELFNAATGRRIEARGVRAGERSEAVHVDMVWMSDVTEGVAAVDTLTKENDALKEKNRSLECTLDGMSSPIWLRDDDLSLIYCNATYIKAVDARSANDVTSRGRELAPRASVREVRALAAAARASGVTRRAPFHMVIEGSRRLLEVTENPVSMSGAIVDDEELEDNKSRPSLFGDGSGLMTAGIAYDITRQEELETRLRRETASHAEVLERLGTAIAFYAADQRLAFYNTAFSQLWDLDPAWLRDGPTYGDIMEALRDQRRLPEVADFPAFKEQELDRFHSLIDPLEDVLHLPDGGTLRRVIAPHPMGGLLTTYEDVTDTLALEQSYNTLIAVQRETIDNLNEAIAVFSADGQLQLANPAFLSLWGLPPEVVEERISIAYAVDRMSESFGDGTVQEQHRGIILNAMQPNSQAQPQQARFERADGKVLEVTTVALPDGGALFSYDDVSDPARVETALRARARDLSASEQLRSTFFADAMSELRAPLGSFLTQVSNNKRKGNTAYKSTDAIEDLVRLVDDIAELAALESDRDTLSLDSFDLRAALDSTLSLTKETMKAHSWELNIKCPDSIGWLVGDEQRIRLLLYHMTTSTLRGAPDESKTTLSLKRTDQKDAGDIIELSTKGPPAPDRDPDAEWTGLSLIRHIADLHGGSVNAKTAKNGARSITCQLPTGS